MTGSDFDWMLSNHAVWGWKAPVKASVSGVSLLFSLPSFPFFPETPDTQATTTASEQAGTLTLSVEEMFFFLGKVYISL